MVIRQAEQDFNLPRLVNNALGGVLAMLQCNSPLFNRVAGQVEVVAGQVNFRGCLPRLASNVLEPMLHPALLYIFSNKVLSLHIHIRTPNGFSQEFFSIAIT